MPSLPPSSEDADDEIDSEDEALFLMLGISPSSFFDVDFTITPPPQSTQPSLSLSSSNSNQTKKPIIITKPTLITDYSSSQTFAPFHVSTLAFTPTSLFPPVLIVRTETRGDILIATTTIPKNTIVFTERSKFSVNVDVGALKIKSKATPFCVECGASLAESDSVAVDLPFADDITWPNKGKEKNSNSNSCCGIRFCGADSDCRRVFEDHSFYGLKCCEYFDCLKVALALDATEEEDDDDNEGAPEPEPEPDSLVLLGIVMFVRCVCSFRKNEETAIIDLSSLAGTSSDFSNLPLISHLPITTMQKTLSRILQLTDSESTTFSSTFLQDCLVKCACNSFEVQTSSPFTHYYNSLIRLYGRDSIEKSTALKCVSLALKPYGNGELDKNMDVMLDELTTIKSGCIFGLIAKINHSCNPNCYVVGKKFTDTTVDLMTSRELMKGEEISISYLNLGQGAGSRANRKSVRQEELKKRYNFDCKCERCD